MMAEQDLSQYLAFLLASANRQMRIGLGQSIGDEAFNEEHWRILQVLSDDVNARLLSIPLLSIPLLQLLLSLASG